MLLFLFFTMIELKPERTQALADLELFTPGVVAVSPDGILCIADWKEHQLVFLDREMKLITRAGRHGQGPGEFQQLADVRWHQAVSAFCIIDFQNTRLSLWSEGMESSSARV